MASNPDLIDINSIDEKLRKQLSALLDTMIPPNDELGVPGAGDEEIVSQVTKSIRSASLQRIVDGLEEIEQSTLVDLNRAFSDLTQEEREKWFHEHDLASHGVVRTIGSITLQSYYCDSRVLESLGAEPRAPFPQGFEVKQGDLSLLDPVRARGAIYRETN